MAISLTLPQAKFVHAALKEAWAAAEAADDGEAMKELDTARALFRGHGPGGDL